MFMMYEEEEMKFPIRVWLEEHKDSEKSHQEQTYHLSQLPFPHKWVCLMPDIHARVGIPIGGVITTDGVVIPNAVGVDIGCGMTYTETNIKVDDIGEITTGSGSLIQAMVGDIMRNVPVGSTYHKTEMPRYTMENAFNELEKYEGDAELLEQLEAGFYQTGTLGGGSHFVELQADDGGCLCVMVHSGSHHIRESVCDYPHFRARELSRRWYSGVLDEYRLAFPPVDTGEGRQYLNRTQLSMDFAEKNRKKMILATKSVLEKYIGKYMDLELKFSHDINCHHDYMALGHHCDEDVWMHRKGAARVGDGELTAIPRTMGSYSYVVMGKGNLKNFCSFSHGIEHRYPRKDVIVVFSYEEAMMDLQKQGIILGKKGETNVAGESRFVYRDIQEIMNNRLDLVMPVKRLRTTGVVKGQEWV